MTLLELREKISKMVEDFGTEALGYEVYVCIVHTDCREEKLKLESVGCCDGGYIPDGDEDKSYIVLDGFE